MAAINKPAQPLIAPTDVEDVEAIAGAAAADAIASDTTHAPLVNDLVPAAHLPSYVDDVLEFATLEAFPAEGEAGKIYVALDTNNTYRWADTTYVQVGGSEIDLTPYALKTEVAAGLDEKASNFICHVVFDSSTIEDPSQPYTGNLSPEDFAKLSADPKHSLVEVEIPNQQTVTLSYIADNINGADSYVYSLNVGFDAHLVCVILPDGSWMGMKTDYHLVTAEQFNNTFNALADVVDTKASASEVAGLADTVATKADASVVAAKADAATVTALAEEVAAKANADAINAALAEMEDEIAAKAGSAAIEELEGEIAAKANSADVELALNEKQDTLEFNPTIPSDVTPAVLSVIKDGDNYYAPDGKQWTFLTSAMTKEERIALLHTAKLPYVYLDNYIFTYKDSHYGHYHFAQLRIDATSANTPTLGSLQLKQIVVDGYGKIINTDSFSGTTSLDQYTYSDQKIPSTKAVMQYVDSRWITKQDALVSGTNIKTINNQSVLGEGNLEINGFDGVVMAGTDAETGVPVVYIPENKGLYKIHDEQQGNSGWILFTDTTWVACYDSSLVQGSYDGYQPGDYVSFDDGECYYATMANLADKQDTLVSGTNIKSINGQSILGEGNLEIQIDNSVRHSINVSCALNEQGELQVTDFYCDDLEPNVWFTEDPKARINLSFNINKAFYYDTVIDCYYNKENDTFFYGDTNLELYRQDNKLFVDFWQKALDSAGKVVYDGGNDLNVYSGSIAAIPTILANSSSASVTPEAVAEAMSELEATDDDIDSLFE